MCKVKSLNWRVKRNFRCNFSERNLKINSVLSAGFWKWTSVRPRHCMYWAYQYVNQILLPLLSIWLLLVSSIDGINPAPSRRLWLPCDSLFLKLHLTCMDLKIKHLTINCRRFLQLSMLFWLADPVELSHLRGLK